MGVSGIPGSGKSVLAIKLVAALNSAWQERNTAELTANASADLAIVVGMDGWHYPRSTLSTFSDSQKAFDRRGAEWTFDSNRFANFVVAVKDNASATLLAPSFDHAKKDPLEDDVAVLSSHRVVVFEGLYCNCDAGHWKRAAEQFDTRLVFEIDKEEAKQRLIARHVATGVAKDTEEAIWRGKIFIQLQHRPTTESTLTVARPFIITGTADNSDLPNGDWLMSHLLSPYTLVKSIDDPTWRRF